MTLTKADIVESIYNNCGYSLTRSTDITESTLEIIKKTLESGEDVMISGFGKFYITQKKERKGRNPATGDTLMLKSRKIVTFKSAGVLRKKLNGVSITEL
ncbi:MAG: integration host factor subunit alpha [Syntrophaceae bacterium]|nr:integration host factor subunit alpha [Syntrophaceae bacterium]